MGLGGINLMKRIQFFFPRLEYVVLLALFWSIAANGPRLLNFDGDLPRHLLLGRLIRETRSVPLTDTFSFRTEGLPSVPHEWLSQVALSIVNDVLGLGGIILLTALIVIATWAIIFHETERRGSRLFIRLFVVALGIGVNMIHVLPRPHLFTFLFTAIWVAALERINGNKPRLWWLLPLLMVLWVNMHGMFILGMMIWGIYLLGSFLENPSREWFSKSSTRSMLFAGSASLLATFFSPNGIKIWEAIVSLGSNSYITSRIPEYQSADFHNPATWPFILLLILTIIGFARRGSKTSWIDILLAVSFAAIALYTSRMIPLFAIVAVPITARTLSDWINVEFSQSRFLVVESNITDMNSISNGGIWVFVLAIAVALLFYSGTPIDAQGKGNRFDNGFFPVQAVDWLNSHPQSGHMFNEFDWGGYLLLKLKPRQQIFMDGHTHIYGEALTREYETVVTLGKDWEKIFDKYQIEWAILRGSAPIAGALEKLGWEILYQDDTAVILHKP
jgi:hypothetical protein